MPGFQPRMTTDHVWYDGTDIHTYSLATGLGIRLTEIRGWDDRVDVRDVREARHGQHGEWTDNTYLGGRTITVMGAIHGSSWVDLQARKRALMALFMPQTNEVLFKIPDPATAAPTAVYATTGMSGYERTSVKVTESLIFGDMIGSTAMTFQVILRASDPRIYSDVEVSTDSSTAGTGTRTVAVDQTGTYETPTTVTITGPVSTGWAVSEPTANLNVASSSLFLSSSSETLTIDSDERTLTALMSYSNRRRHITGLRTGWMLNESAGAVADNFETTATYDGAYTGGYTLNQAGPASGVTSVLLNGTTGYVNVPYAAALNPTTFTYETWIYPTVALNQGGVVSAGNGASTGWGLNYGGFSAGQLYAYVVTAAGPTVVTASTTLALSTWYHVVMTVSVGAVSLYINGSLVATTALTAWVPNTTSATRIGYDFLLADFFAGNIGPSALYTRAMDAVEVSELYGDSTAASVSFSAYPFLTASTARWRDVGSAATTFSLTGSGFTAANTKLNVKHRPARL